MLVYIYIYIYNYLYERECIAWRGGYEDNDTPGT